ncbi:NADH:flavin oxidoreductase/NADH oxidase [Leucobacter sp. CSA1]|uniref:NADH:flavin oxidoreductase/NADH oxidase n=1 Tax=Leucobacter chromiisoli TaxID=2796471 RepID=A0A934Q5X9_9MICO|nr:NADH:flavin oxidoreductase/NADH oxidase [Leucobacter chromiisoli]MBK0418980.1 NADH:flavin oxidoreductase/NADH oxidase [Leucobacter chromiisoli]
MADPILFRPLRLRDVEFRNRLWASPMCQYSVTAEDGVATDWHLQHLGSLARGGAGLVLTEATAVVPEGRISALDLGLWNDAQADALARIVDAAHAHGARIGVQLAHAGRKASTHPTLPGSPSGSLAAAEGAWETVAPSAIPFGDFATPRALDAVELPVLVRAFADAADRAVRAGADAVEVHAAHGYLLHEFLSPLSNHRRDAYGGELAGRARLLREIVREIRDRHASLPILVRVSATEWVPGGFSVEEATELSSWLADDGADLIDVSSAANVPSAPIPVGPSYQVGLAAEVRRGPLPVAAVGLITQAAQAEGILATGQADTVLLGRALLTDPHLPIRWAHELRAPSAAALVPPQYARARF